VRWTHAWCRRLGKGRGKSEGRVEGRVQERSIWIVVGGLAALTLTGAPFRRRHVRACYARTVSSRETADEREFPMPEIDANGVDRSQIRAALRLTPVERLRLAEQFVEDTMRLWEQNGIRPLR
jgi:hypothetical protein